MERKIILLFAISLLLTLFFVRVSSHFFHDFNNYDGDNPLKSKAKTFTGVLRRTTGFDWHHIHLGAILLVVLIPLILLGFINPISIIFLGIGISLFLDQVLPLLNFGNYFGNGMILLSLILHLIILETALIIYFN
jgi:hypothetical protein